LSSQVIVTALSMSIWVAVSAGIVALIAGNVLSTVTVLPMPGSSLLLDVSVALL
jgi:hypothetical protein